MTPGEEIICIEINSRKVTTQQQPILSSCIY